MSGVLDKPDLPLNVPKTSQWLAGQGAGSWFWIDETSVHNQYLVKRFSPSGTLECQRTFECLQPGFLIHDKYEFTYLSHCAFCTILQKGKTFTFQLT